MKKTVIFFTAHPAPYWDHFFYNVEKEINLKVVYNYTKNHEKDWKRYSGFKGFLFNFESFFNILYLILKSDHIIIGGIYFKRYLFVLYLSFLMRKKISLFSDVPSSKYRSHLKVSIKKWFIYSLFDKIFIAAKSAESFYNKHYNIPSHKFVHFPYAWDSSYKNVVFKKIIQNKVIFISNRFIDRKGYNIFFEALDNINKEKVLKYFKIYIAGNGPLKDFYEKKYGDKFTNIVFLDWIEIEQYFDYLKRCDIYIHPSLFEPFGVPVIDAMNLAKVTIVSDGVMSGIDFIRNKENGFIYKSDSPEELSVILNDILEDKFDLELIARNARKSIPDYNFFIQNFISSI